MLFSKEKWNNAKEVMPYMQASAALSFEKCASSFEDAENKYLLTVFGPDLLSRIQAIYASENRTEKESELLKLAQSAECNLALDMNFDEFNVRLTDMGVQRQETDKFKQAYKYQEEAIKRLYRNRGLNTLDLAIDFLNRNIDGFPEWEVSEYRQKSRRSIVRSAREINELYHIENSGIIYMMLLPDIDRAVLKLQGVIGAELYFKLVDALERGDKYVFVDSDGITAESFRKECVRYVVMVALASFISMSGRITDRGLFFSQTVASGTNPEENRSVGSDDRHEAETRFLATASMYARALERDVQNFYPQYFHGNECDVLKRDNNGKNTFWL